MTIGITGSTGILGRILTEQLLFNDKDCIVVPFKGDIAKELDVIDWLAGNKFDVVFHLAAIVPVAKVEQDPIKAYQVNIIGMVNLLQAIEKSGTHPWIFFSSTSHVYKSSNKPIKENDEIDPINTYGFTKYKAEELLFKYAQLKRMSYCIGRVFSFYHSTQEKPFLFPSILDRLSNEDLSKPFLLKGANSVRDILNAEKIVEIMIQLMNKRYTGIVNIGSGIGLKIKEFVQQFTEVKLIIEGDPSIKEDYLVADTSVLRSILENE